MALPPLGESPSKGLRASTAPAGSPGSGRRGGPSSSSSSREPQRPVTAASPPTTQKPSGQRPVTAASQLMSTSEPPGTARSSTYNRTWPNRAQTEVMQMVHAYWAPVEEAVRTRHPGKLEAALREMHGSEYLRTICTVRHSNLKASERHAVEMELAARLVRARAVLGKWQAGMREIREARYSRDAERLDKMLAKWTFTEEDPEIGSARNDLERWHDLALTLPAVLKEATENLDVGQLRKAVDQLNISGPNGVVGSSGAKKILSRYDLQAKALGNAVNAGSSRAIAEALRLWKFDDQDPHIEAGRSAMEKYEGQKAALCRAVQSMDGPSLQKAVDEWEFEMDSPVFFQAKTALNRYVYSQEQLSGLAQKAGSLPELAEAMNMWEFAEDDPVLQDARGVLGSFEETIRIALRSADGWQLERLWGSGKVLRSLFAGDGNLYDQGVEFLQRYETAVSELRDVLQRAEDLNADLAPVILRLVEEWEFAQNDPTYEAGLLWLQFHRAVVQRNVAALHNASQAGDVFALRDLLPNARRSTTWRCTELRAAEDACKAYEEAVGFVGAVALGVEPQQLKGALDRSARLDRVMGTIRTTVESMDVRWIAGLKGMTKPPPIVHAVFQMIVHILAGISPLIREPPKDSDWKTCQKMISNGPDFFAKLLDVPDWIASGHMSGVGRARTLALGNQVQYEGQWCGHGIAPHNACAAALYDFLVHVFTYADLIEAAEAGIRSGSRPSSRNAGSRPSSRNAGSRPSSRNAGSRPAAGASASPEPHLPTGCDAQMFDNLPSAVESVRGRVGHVVRSRSLTDEDTGLHQQQPLAMIEPMHPLMTLHKARRSLCRTKVLAIAWVLSGRDAKELEVCVDRARSYACTAKAAALVAEQLVAHFLPRRRTLDSVDSLVLSAGDGNSPSSTDRAITGDDLMQKEEVLSPAVAEAAAPSNALNCITVKLMSGEVVANLQIDSTTMVSELKQRLASIEGTPALQLRLLHRGQTLLDAADLQMIAGDDSVTLIRLAPTLPQLLESAAHSASSTSMFNTTGASFRPSTSSSIRPSTSPSGDRPIGSLAPTDAASYLMFGPHDKKLSSRPKKGNLQMELLKVLQATKQAMHERSIPLGPAPLSADLQELSDFQLRAEPMSLDQETVATSQVPLINLALAWRALSAGEVSQAVHEFVGAMSVFFTDFLPLRAAMRHTALQAEAARNALKESEEVAAFAGSLESIGKAHSIDIHGVRTAATYAMDQVQVLALRGVALPAMYVEYIRQAIDDAGVHLLANPPAADPSARIRWSEAAMAIQLAPLPHFSTALKGIAKIIDVVELQQFGNRKIAPAAECVRLIGAVLWTIQPSCRCNPGWVEAKLALGDAAGFVENLQAWSPVRDVSVARVTRSRDLLLGIWAWAAAGCGGSAALCSLFAWVSLVVSFVPIADMAQRLTPVFKAVKQGIAKSQRAPANKQVLAKSKAWTAALFLLDGPEHAEAWWWLRLIRPAAHMELPWTDTEDGGVGHGNDRTEEEAENSIVPNPAEKSVDLGPKADTTTIDECRPWTLNDVIDDEDLDLEDLEDQALTGGQLDVMFKPGKLGMTLKWETGSVTKITANGQAQCNDIKIGMIVNAIDGEAFSENLLKGKLAGSQAFEITFEDVSRLAEPTNAVPSLVEEPPRSSRDSQEQGGAAELENSTPAEAPEAAAILAEVSATASPAELSATVLACSS